MYLSRDARARVKIIFLGGLLFVIVTFVVLPRLDTFTGGALSARFENTDSTGRNTIAGADVQIWLENPFFGVGPGESKVEHALYYRTIATHTEYTRLLAEHGLFGIVAGLLLFVMAARSFLRIGRMRNINTKALLAPMEVWALLYMIDKAMRLVAPAFTFGLSFIMIRERRTLTRVTYIEVDDEALSRPQTETSILTSNA
jgi:O-antigen ligase